MIRNEMRIWGDNHENKAVSKKISVDKIDKCDFMDYTVVFELKFGYSD
jgi:hypothetical protein